MRRLNSTIHRHWQAIGLADRCLKAMGLRRAIQTRAGADWHGIAPARLGTELGNLATSNSSPPRSSIDEWNRPPADHRWSHGQRQRSPFFDTGNPKSHDRVDTRSVTESMDRWDLRPLALQAQQWIEQRMIRVRGEARLLLERRSRVLKD